MTETLAFNRWPASGIRIEDPGLVTYINLDVRYVPRTGATYAGNKFHKSKTFIVERLINRLMVPGHKSKKHWRTSGHATGKAPHAYNVVFNAFKLIEQRLKKNPLEVFVKAIENAAPREEIVAIEYGGARYPKATECSPQRRVDLVLRYFVQGAYAKCFNAKKTLVQALADEITFSYQLSANSMAIAKKNEIERQADSSR